MMAGFSKIYIIGGSGGFLGSDGVNPIIVQILVGRSDGEWLEVNYLDSKYDSLCGIKKIIPRKPVDDDTILEGYNAEFVMPDTLIKLSLEADSFLSY